MAEFGVTESVGGESSPVRAEPQGAGPELGRSLPTGQGFHELHAEEQERFALLTQLLADARDRLPHDPFPHYLGHFRLEEGTSVVDVLLITAERRTAFRGGAARERCLVVDYIDSELSEIFYGGRVGEHYRVGPVQGVLAQRNLVGFSRREIVDVQTEAGLYSRRGSGVWHRAADPILRSFEPRSVAAQATPASVVDVHLDPAQRRVVELPAGRSVLILGEAGHGKTTVALHRLAALARRSPGRFRAAVLVPSVGLELLLAKVLGSLSLNLEVAVYDKWAVAQTRQAFRGAVARVSESATASIVRFKRDPALRLALQELAARAPGRIDGAKSTSARVRRRGVGRGDLQHLFGDRALIAKVLAASTAPIAVHGVAELIEHTRVQFSARTEAQYAHVEKERLRTVDGRVLDAGTPMEDAGSIDPEDCAVLFELERLRARASGREPLPLGQFDCVVLDEAQELAPLELALIGRTLRPGGTLIVAGDADQQTDPAAFFAGWPATMEALGVAHYESVTLTVNYRCPPEVVQLASRLRTRSSPSGQVASARLLGMARPMRFFNEAHLGVWLAGALREALARDPSGAIAVICRAQPTAWRLMQLLRRTLPTRLVTDGRFAVSGAVNVTTVEQVKGLEFDYVVVPDASAVTYPDDPASRRALYVAITRARHEVALASVTAPSPLIESTAPCPGSEALPTR